MKKRERKTSIRLRDGDKEKIDELLLFEQAKRRNPRFSFTDYVREMIDSHESCKTKEQGNEHQAKPSNARTAAQEGSTRNGSQ